MRAMKISSESCVRREKRIVARITLWEETLPFVQFSFWSASLFVEFAMTDPSPLINRGKTIQRAFYEEFPRA